MEIKKNSRDKKILIDSLDTATLKCPECNATRMYQVSKYTILNSLTRVKCKCKCGYSYRAVLETKKTSQEMLLLGTYKTIGKQKSGGRMTVKKLNNKGIVFRTNSVHKIKPRYRLRLEFVLDDVKQSIVSKKVIVTAGSGKYITARFCSKEHYDNLGQYLLFNKLFVF